MAYNLFNTINYSSTFTEYSPQTAGLGMEPAVSVASMIRSTILSAPLTWAFNRNENSSLVTTAGTQDYTVNITDFGFLEKASLLDNQGNRYEIKDVYNNAALASGTTPQSRPSSIAVLTSIPYTSAKFRFLGVPDAVYTCTLTYQKAVPVMGPFILSGVNNAAGGNTVYNGNFDPLSFPANSTAQISGFGNAANNGSFVVVSCTSTALTVVSSAGIAQTQTGYASNFDWYPLPDSFSYIYNSLYLGEIFSMVDDARSAQYRQRGVASLLSKSEGLSEMQKNIWAQQYLARGMEQQAVGLRVQQGQAGRGV